MESPKIKLKIKIINIDVEKLKMVDDALITIKKQNRIYAVNERFLRLVKKIVNPLSPKTTKFFPLV